MESDEEAAERPGLTIGSSGVGARTHGTKDAPRRDAGENAVALPAAKTCFPGRRGR
jgi:hypothetical protein